MCSEEYTEKSYYCAYTFFCKVNGNTFFPNEAKTFNGFRREARNRNKKTFNIQKAYLTLS